MKDIFLQQRNIFLIAFFIISNSFAADLIIFSYNRPLQLEALLRSADRHIYNLDSTSVLYRSDNTAFDAAYNEIITTYPTITFIKQGPSAQKDFKPLLLHILENTQSDYLLFAVDDIIVTDNIDIKECVEALQQTNAYGFFLRLGKNITFSYTHNSALKLPRLTPINNNIFSFTFAGNKSYWCYPNTVDMTIYKKSRIMPFFKNAHYSSPNKLESVWHRQANFHQQGLCYEHSKIVNTPLNIVQEDWNNKHDDLYEAHELLSFWQKGLRIDIDDLYKMNNNTAHISYQPIFINKGIK